ncbi:MAG: hypothetical protein M0R70_12700 [Nitrospirae bacterium]|nr:hypothetical protein [Nitrospirota bacterium]
MSFAKSGVSPNIVVTVTNQNWTMQNAADDATVGSLLVKTTLASGKSLFVCDVKNFEFECADANYTFSSENEIISNKNNSLGSFQNKSTQGFVSIFRWGQKTTDNYGTSASCVVLGYSPTSTTGGSAKTKHLMYGSSFFSTNTVAGLLGGGSEVCNCIINYLIMCQTNAPDVITGTTFQNKMIQMLIAPTIFTDNTLSSHSAPVLLMNANVVIKNLQKSAAVSAALFTMINATCTLRNPKWDATINQIAAAASGCYRYIDYPLSLKVVSGFNGANPPAEVPIEGALVNVWEINQSTGVQTEMTGSPFTTDANGMVELNLKKYNNSTTACTPHRVRVSKAGLVASEFPINMNEQKSMTLKLGVGGEPALSVKTFALEI